MDKRQRIGLRTHTRTSGASGIRREPRYVVGVRNRHERQYRHERCYGASHRHGRGGYASLSRERVRRSVAVMISKRRTRTNKRGEKRVHPQRARERSPRHPPYSPYSDNRLTRERRDTHTHNGRRTRGSECARDRTRRQELKDAALLQSTPLQPLSLARHARRRSSSTARAPALAACAVEFSALGFRGMGIVAGVRLSSLELLVRSLSARRRSEGIYFPHHQRPERKRESLCGLLLAIPSSHTTTTTQAPPRVVSSVDTSQWNKLRECHTMNCLRSSRW